MSKTAAGVGQFIPLHAERADIWMIRHHVFRMNRAVLMGGVAGARSHSGLAK